MPEEYIKREEYSQGQRRLHERVDEITKSVIRQEANGQSVKESVDKIFVAFYGNGKDGVIAKLGKICGEVKTHFRLIMACFGGIGIVVATGFFVIRSILTK